MPVPLFASRWVLVACLVALLRLQVMGHYYQVMTLGVAVMEGEVKVQVLLVKVDSPMKLYGLPPIQTEQK